METENKETQQDTENIQVSSEDTVGGNSAVENNENPSGNDNLNQDFQAKFNEINDKYLRLYSEFDNYRKRTQREKIDTIKLAGEDIFKAILPVVDDFERALKSIETANDITAIKEGVELIYNKLKSNLASKGLEALSSIGNDFDADVHEALTKVPAPSEELKGKVLDEIEKCYKLHGKVIRYAKVVVAD